MYCPSCASKAEWHIVAHPHALLLRGGDLVADAFTRDLALELGKGQQHIERQAAHRARRIELLRHRDERHSLSRSDTNREAIISICELRSRPICLILPRSSDRALAKPSAVR